ncbi:MAG: very short patch repair endonuclease [Solirubrobacteraceae bacterium]
MADIFTPEKRSEVMAAIRSSGTKPELRLIAMVQELVGEDLEVDCNVRTLPGTPDVVVPELDLAIFADGCFFHGCPKHGKVPSSNVDYWAPKLARNVQRDTRSRAALRRRGYAVWRFWEHDLTGRRGERTLAILAKRLERRRTEVGRTG